MDDDNLYMSEEKALYNHVLLCLTDYIDSLGLDAEVVAELLEKISDLTSAAFALSGR